MCDVHNEVAFVVVRPRKWYDVVVELKEGRPVKFIETELVAHGFAVECNKKDIVELRGHQPEACVRFRTNDGFAVDKDVIFKDDV